MSDTDKPVSLQGEAGEVALAEATAVLAMIGAAYGFEVTHILSRDELAALPAILARPGPQFIIVETSIDAVRPRPTRETP